MYVVKKQGKTPHLTGLGRMVILTSLGFELMPVIEQNSLSVAVRNKAKKLTLLFNQEVKVKDKNQLFYAAEHFKATVILTYQTYGSVKRHLEKEYKPMYRQMLKYEAKMLKKYAE